MPMRARSLRLVGTFCGLCACGAQSQIPSKEPPALVLRPALEEFRKLRGQWRGVEVGRDAVWTFSLAKTADEPAISRALPVEKQD